MTKNREQLIREKADSIFDVFLDEKKYINLSSANGQRIVQIYYQKAMVEALERKNELLNILIAEHNLASDQIQKILKEKM